MQILQFYHCTSAMSRQDTRMSNAKHKQVTKAQIETLRYMTGAISEMPSSFINSRRSLIRSGLVDANRDPVKTWVERPTVNAKGLAMLA